LYDVLCHSNIYKEIVLAVIKGLVDLRCWIILSLR
jgi:hypothetical protein